MLLTSLSSMIGAILVPSAYLWLYSTHITLLCLYLIRTKRVLVLFLTLISLFAVWFSETQVGIKVTLSEKDRYFINLDNKRLLLLTSDSNLDDQQLARSVAVRLHLTEGQDNNNLATDRPILGSPKNVWLFHDFQLIYSTQIPIDYSEVRLQVYAKADRNGAWWLKQLYIDRQSAQLELLALEDMMLPFSLRCNLLAKLDDELRKYSTWRFSKALLFGDDEGWSQRDLWVVRTLGLAHLFVVSGLHAGFMFLIGLLFAKAIWHFLPAAWLLKGLTRHHVELICSVPLLVLYGYLTQWGEPVTRAAIMLSLYMLCRCLLMRSSVVQILAITLWVVLLINPRSILSPGLWLSFSMVYLLISFYSVTRFKWSRLLLTQLMLSTASMVLILGWQEAISITSVAVNLCLIPFAALVWFPLSLFACVEVMLLSSNGLYAILEYLLHPLWGILESLAFDLPLLFFAESYSVLSKWLLLLLLLFWVLQSPLRRGWLALACIWCVLFNEEEKWLGTSDIQITQRRQGWFIEQADERIAVKWLSDSQRRLTLREDQALVNQQAANQQIIFLLAETDRPYLARDLLSLDADWLIVPTKSVSHQRALWTALSINWLDIDLNESLFLYFDETELRVKHSRCQYAFFLFKSDTCMRAEKLESVLN